MSKEYRYFETKEEAMSCVKMINYSIYKDVEIKHYPERYFVQTTLDQVYDGVWPCKEWEVSRVKKGFLERLFDMIVCGR